MPSERRQHVRYETPSFSSSLDIGKIIEIDVKDLGLGGMAFETRNRPSVGKCYTVHLRLGPESVRVDGTIVWCHLAATVHNTEGEVVPIYRAGMRFIPELAPEMKGLMQKLEQQAFITESGEPVVRSPAIA